MVMRFIAGLNRETLILSMLVEGVGCVEDKEDPQFPRGMSGGSPSSGGGSSDCRSHQSSQKSKMMRVSGEK